MKIIPSRSKRLRVVCVIAALVFVFFAGGAYAATWTHSVSGGYDTWYLDGAQRFQYNLTSQQWWHYSTIKSTWYTLSATGRPNTNFCETGAWYDLGTGLKYRFDTPSNFGYFNRGASYRFYYRYGPGQWYASGCGGGWYTLGIASRPAGVTNGGWYDLGNGLNYQYLASTDFGYFKRGGTYRFYFRYGPGQWYNSGYAGGWYTLGPAGKNAATLCDGGFYYLQSGVNFLYNSTYDRNFFFHGTAYRLYYNNVNGQWNDNVATRGWLALGATHRNAAFIGPGAWHPLGEGYSYQYVSSYDMGYFYFDATHQFRQAYTNGSWQYRHDASTWSSWDSATSVTGSTYLAYPGAFAVMGGNLYFYANGALYRWNGDTLAQVAVVTGPLTYLATYGTNLFYDGPVTEGTSTYHGLYMYNGVSFGYVGGGHNSLNALEYLGAVNARLYFSVIDPSTFRYDVYKCEGAAFSNASNGAYGSVRFMAILGSDLFFAGYIQFDGWDLYKVPWIGGSAVKVWDGANAQSIQLLARGTDHFYSWVWLSCTQPWLLYKWDGTSFDEVGGQGFTTPGPGAEVAGDLFFTAKASGATVFDVFRYAGGLTNVTHGDLDDVLYVAASATHFYFSGENADAWGLYRLAAGQVVAQYLSGLNYFAQPYSFLGASGADMYFAGTDAYGNSRIFRCNNLVPFLSVSGGQSFPYVQFLGASGANVYFKAGVAGSNYPWEIYRWNGATLAAVTDNGFNSYGYSASSWIWYQGDLYLDGYCSWPSDQGMLWHYWTDYELLSLR